MIEICDITLPPVLRLLPLFQMFGRGLKTIPVPCVVQEDSVRGLEELLVEFVQLILPAKLPLRRDGVVPDDFRVWP